MENATKALLIAAGVLFGLMIISIALVMHNNVSNYYENMKSEEITKQLAIFNGQYLIYQKDDLRGNDLVSLVNKILDFNKGKAEEEPEIKISIYIPDNAKAREGFYHKYDKYNRTGDTNTTLLKIGETYVHNVVSGKEYIKDFLDDVRVLESGNKKRVLETLSANISTLIIEEGLTPERQHKAEQAQAELLKRVGKSYSTQLRNEVLKYYQYQQFRRAHFDCQITNYTETGRVESFEVIFNGEFE